MSWARSEPCYVSDVTELAVGIDFGGTKMLGVLVDADGNVHDMHRLPTPYDGEELLDDLVELLETLETRAETTASGLGVGAAGLVTRDGVLSFGPNVGRVRDVDIKAGLAKRRPELHVVVDNDATCATWSEHRTGAGKGIDEVVFVSLGTGIGSGLVTGGSLVRGAQGFGGEHGHMVIQVDGIECVCGHRGCWEAYASGRALGRMGRKAAAAGKAREVLRAAGAVPDIRGEHVTRAARDGDAQAIAILDEFARWVAIGIANAIAISDPQLVIVGGGMAEDADLFLDQVEIELQNFVYGAPERPKVPVVRAALGERAGAMGAAMLTFVN